MKALILVDIQNDFTPAGQGASGKPAGSLAVPNGDEVIAVANRLMPTYPLVVATQDWHPADHLSFASQHEGNHVGDVIELGGLDQVLWPDHCVQDTFGAAFCDGLNHDGIHEIVRKGGDRQIDSYSGFFDNGLPGKRNATGLEALLKEHGVDEVHVMGLATDYCVKFTALHAVTQGFKTSLIVEGCRGVELTPGDCDRAIEAMRQAGVEIVSYSAIRA